MRKVWVAIGLWFITTGLAGAQVQESREWIVGSEQHSIIAFLTDFGYLRDKTIPPKTVAVLVDAGGSFADITVVGSTTANARDLGEILYQGLGANRLVQFSQEDDYAAAQVSQSSVRLFQTSSHQSFNLDSVKKQFESKGFKVLTVLRTTGSSTITPSNLILRNETRKGKYYEFDGPGAIPPISVQCTLQPWCLIVLFLVFVAPPLAVGLGILVPARLAMDVRTDKKIRLERFTRVCKVAIVLPIAVGSVFSLWAIFSHQMAPLCDLWFGTRTTLPLVPLSMLPVLIVLPSAFAIGKIEMKLKSEKDVDSADFVPPQKAPPSRLVRLQGLAQLVLMVLGLGVYCYLTSFPRKEYGDLPRIVGLLFFAVSIFSRYLVAPFFKLRPAPFDAAWQGQSVFTPDDPASAEALKERAIDIAAKKRVNLVSFVIAEPGDAKEALSPSFFQGILRIPKRAIRELDRDELDFALSYALDSTSRQLLWILGPTMAVLLIFLLVQFALRLSSISLIFSVPLLVFCVTGPFVPYLLRRAEADGVRRALAVAPNFEAARSYFSKLRADAAPKSRFGAKTVDPWDNYAKRYGHDAS